MYKKQSDHCLYGLHLVQLLPSVIITIVPIFRLIRFLLLLIQWIICCCLQYENDHQIGDPLLPPQSPSDKGFTDSGKYSRYALSPLSCTVHVLLAWHPYGAEVYRPSVYLLICSFSIIPLQHPSSALPPRHSVCAMAA